MLDRNGIENFDFLVPIPMHAGAFLTGESRENQGVSTTRYHQTFVNKLSLEYSQSHWWSSSIQRNCRTLPTDSFTVALSKSTKSTATLITWYLDKIIQVRMRNMDITVLLCEEYPFFTAKVLYFPRNICPALLYCVLFYNSSMLHSGVQA